jgi:hypothetical protein
MSNAIDFTSLFTIQRQYLADLSAITSTGMPTANYYTQLKTDLSGMYADFSNASPASSAALDHQNQMKEILNQENQRLESKKAGIDNAYKTQKRLIELNESYREKNMAYINILIVIIISMIIYLALLFISRYLPFVPGFIINLLTATLFTTSFIIICVIIARINKRDPMNYQKLLFVPPKTQDGNVYGNVYGNTFLGFNFATCIGENCCGNGTIWNETYGNCMVTSPFTLMSESGNCGSCGGVIPYFPFEYNSYAKI